MSKQKQIKERIATPLIMPKEGIDPVNDKNVKWCYFVFYSDNSTGLDFSIPTKKEKIYAIENFFNI